MIGLVATLLAASLLSSPLEPAWEGELREFVRESPRCPRKAQACFGIALHVARDDHGWVVSPQWFAEHLERANRLFAQIDVGFRVASVDKLPTDSWRIRTRRDRDNLGLERFTTGTIHVFLVGRLDDVDRKGEVIRGVHWKQRGENSRRWVVVSRIAWPNVTPHELGHFFGLPHSKYPISIMNKNPREHPPRAARGFHPREIEKMSAARDKMVETGSLVPRGKSAPKAPVADEVEDQAPKDSPSTRSIDSPARQ